MGAHRNGKHAVEVCAQHSVEFVKGAMGTGAGVHIDHAQFGASMGTVTADGGMFG